ncbi:MAG TPA: SufE family protein [Patescibacteria group bacterium]|nr:SufE family protein [Patescibacteria group bacterium]
MSIDDLVDNFTALEDWEDRYKYLIDLGNAMPAMEESLKTEHAKVRGCMSQVWLVMGWDGQGRLTMTADSDAQIVKGLIAVLVAIFAGRNRAEINEIDVEATFARLGLDQHLSPNRRNGFFSMVEAVKAFTSGPHT